MFVRACPYFPFSTRICLNQHHWLAHQMKPAREIGGHMDQVFPALIDRSRVLLDLKTVRTILGYQRRPRYHKRKKKPPEWEVAVEKPVYDLTIFKLHCSRLTLKIYTKGERVLRIEVVVHNTQELRRGRSLEKFPEIVVEAKSILERCMDALSCIDQCFIADRLLEQLPDPSQIGQNKVGGIDLNKARMRWVIEALIVLSPSPGGFTASELARQVRALSKQSGSDYGPLSRRLRPEKTPRQEDRPSNRTDPTLRILAQGPESDGRALGSQKQSDQALARWHAGATAVARRAESQRLR